MDLFLGYQTGYMIILYASTSLILKVKEGNITLTSTRNQNF